MEEKNIFAKRKLVLQDILKHIQKDYGKIITISQSQVALSNDVFFIETSAKKLVLKIFNNKNKHLFNIHNHKRLINYFAEKNLTPSCLFFNHKYCVLEYIKGTPLQTNNISIKNFTSIIKEIHSSQLNINQRNFLHTTKSYLKGIPSQHLENKLFKDAVSLSQKLFTIIAKFPKDYTVCHNDLNVNNFIQTQEKLYILDFEYATINDKYFDFASIKTFLNKDDFAIFIKKYDINLDDTKLFAYSRLIEFISSIWCFMMNYQEDAEIYAKAMIEKTKDLN
ncbi:MAG: phosphotransferase [Alphaproteobacteria bacterium]|jgi:thiamine kinase-like enzyme|nr:phosphotransferase [Alphaproteobacteria bacterium]